MNNDTIMLIGKLLIILSLVIASIVNHFKTGEGGGYGFAAFILILWWIQ